MSHGHSPKTDILRDETNTKRAGYVSVSIAKVAMSFSITYPESMSNESNSEKYVAQGGVIFVAVVSGPEIFEGSFKNSSKGKLLAKLEINGSQQ